MRRNMSLIQEILEWTEENVEGPNDCAVKINCYTSNEVNYHVKLCTEAGFVESSPKVEHGKNPRVVGYTITGLTWNGHNELDKLRGKCL